MEIITGISIFYFRLYVLTVNLNYLTDRFVIEFIQFGIVNLQLKPVVYQLAENGFWKLLLSLPAVRY